MSELVRGLTNLRSLRAAVRELTLEQAESALEKLQAVVVEKREEYAAIQQAEVERKSRIEKYKALIKQEGITAEELQDILGVAPQLPREKRPPRPAKYQFTDDNGEQKTWTGQGRTPRPIQRALDAGKSLSDFEIQ